MWGENDSVHLHLEQSETEKKRLMIPKREKAQKPQSHKVISKRPAMGKRKSLSGGDRERGRASIVQSATSVNAGVARIGGGKSQGTGGGKAYGGAERQSINGGFTLWGGAFWAEVTLRRGGLKKVRTVK